MKRRFNYPSIYDNGRIIIDLGNEWIYDTGRFVRKLKEENQEK